MQRESIDETMVKLVDQDTIVELAQQLDYEQNYKAVFKLFGVRWNEQLNDIVLSMKKLDYIFQHKQTACSLQTQNFKKYVECLTEAHNQMLFLIQDPRNVYPIMEENPLHSQDVLYGVPSAFKDILQDVVENDS